MTKGRKGVFGHQANIFAHAFFAVPNSLETSGRRGALIALTVEPKSKPSERASQTRQSPQAKEAVPRGHPARKIPVRGQKGRVSVRAVGQLYEGWGFPATEAVGVCGGGPDV